MRSCAVVCVSTGIVAGLLSSPALGGSLCGACFAMAGVSRLMFAYSRAHMMFTVFLLAACVSCGWFLLAEKRYEELTRHATSSTEFIGFIQADGEVRGSRAWYVVSVLDEIGSYAVRVSLPRYPQIKPGTFVHVSGDAETPESFKTEGGGTFDYKSFLRARTIVAVIPEGSFTEQADVFQEGVVGNVYATLLRASYIIEHALVTGVRTVLGVRESALILGMTLGRKDDLAEEDLEKFQTAGLTHLVVLSGSNVAIVVAATLAACRRLLGVSRLAHVLSVLITSVMAWGLVLASGADPSARRAGLMSAAALAFASRETKSVTAISATVRGADAFMEAVAGASGWMRLATLTAVAALMGVMHPFAPRFDTSYALSFAAAFAVTFIAPPLSRMLRFIPERFAVRDTFAACVAAQAATYPIIMSMSAGQSWLALPANMIAAPLVPIAMASGAASGALGLFDQMLAVVPAFIATLSTKLIYLIAEVAAS